MLDSDLKPWLIEVNISPSFSSSSPFDKNVKTKLACDTFTLVGFKIFDHNQEDFPPHKENFPEFQG
jgi:tubulin polyglutamylase TTLL4